MSTSNTGDPPPFIPNNTTIHSGTCAIGLFQIQGTSATNGIYIPSPESLETILKRETEKTLLRDPLFLERVLEMLSLEERNNVRIFLDQLEVSGFEPETGNLSTNYMYGRR